MLTENQNIFAEGLFLLLRKIPQSEVVKTILENCIYSFSPSFSVLIFDSKTKLFSEIFFFLIKSSHHVVLFSRKKITKKDFLVRLHGILKDPPFSGDFALTGVK